MMSILTHACVVRTLHGSIPTEDNHGDGNEMLLGTILHIIGLIETIIANIQKAIGIIDNLLSTILERKLQLRGHVSRSKLMAFVRRHANGSTRPKEKCKAK